MENFIPTASVIVTILLVGIALASLIRNSQIRLENRIEKRLTAVESRLLELEKAMARVGGLLEGLGLVGRTNPPKETDPAVRKNL